MLGEQNDHNFKLSSNALRTFSPLSPGNLMPNSKPEIVSTWYHYQNVPE